MGSVIVNWPYEECSFCQYREGISCCKGCNVCPEEEDEDELE